MAEDDEESAGDRAAEPHPPAHKPEESPSPPPSPRPPAGTTPISDRLAALAARPRTEDIAKAALDAPVTGPQVKAPAAASAAAAAGARPETAAATPATTGGEGPPAPRPSTLPPASTPAAPLPAAAAGAPVAEAVVGAGGPAPALPPRSPARPRTHFFRRAFTRLFPHESTRFFVLTAVVGSAAALLAIAFRMALDGAQVLFFGEAPSLLEAASDEPWWRRLIVPTAGAALAGCLASALRRFSQGGGGVAGIMEAVSIRRGLVAFRGALGRAATSLVTIASGGSVGREGPIVQLGSAAASGLGRTVHLSDERLRVLVGCGAAAGIAAAYNTPIAGTLFVLEIVVGTFAVEVLGPTAVSAVLATLITRAVLGEGPLYNVPPIPLVSPLELVPYAALGLLGAGIGALFLSAIEGAERLFRRVPGPPAVRMVLGGLCVGVLGAIGLPHVFGNGYDATSAILGSHYSLGFLALLLFAKMLATAATVGSGGPGGIFTPTLLLGAALGGVVGEIWHDAFPGTSASSGAYALVGMAALLAATTQAPLVSAVFVFEVSHDYRIILPLLLTTVVATLAARRLRPGSVYTDELARRGLSWEGSAEERALRSLKVRDILREKVPFLPPTVPVGDLLKTFLTTRVKYIYVVDAQSRLLGEIDLQALSAAIDAPELRGLVIARDVLRPVPTISPDASIVEANEALWRSDDEQLPVVEPSSGRVLGVVTRRDLLGAIDREILRRNVLLAKIRWRGDEGTVTDFFELPAGNRLEQVVVPPPLEGLTVAEADLRGVHGLNVLAVVRHREDDTVERLTPSAELVFLPGDVLVVIGKVSEIERVARLR